MPHITFIHGIANKPPADKLKKIWLDALASDQLGNEDGIDLGARGVTTSMIYWADVLYENSENADVFEHATDLESTPILAQRADKDPDMSWREKLTGEEKEVIDSLAAKLSFDVLVDDTFTPPTSGSTRNLERIPLPWFIKRRMMKWLLKDVHHYLYNVEFSPRQGITYKVQDEIRSRVLAKLNEVETDKHVVISHSMGTVIMYDCLKRVNACPSIESLMTVGSPLGIDEVQDMLQPEWTRGNGFPEKVENTWVNIFDMLDPVTGFDGNIANDFRKNEKEVIDVINEQNFGAWRHNITNYLSEPKLRAALLKLI
jgi:hypothetical protein